jgi:uncharacterized membrane protein
MLRIILGVIAGFITWSILWLGSDQLMTESMSWYGEHQHAFQRAMFNKEAFSPDITILVLNIIRSLLISLIAGYIAALVANESRRTAAILGVILLLCAMMVEIIAWNYLPLWYHFIFLILLIPATIAGGALRKAASGNKRAEI